MSFRGRRIDQTWGWIFVAAIVSMLWVIGTVEAKAASLGLEVTEVSVQSGKIQTGSKHRTSQLGSSHCAEEVEPQRVPKLRRDTAQNLRGKKTPKKKSGSSRSRKSQTGQGQKGRYKTKPLEEESLPKVITRKVGSGLILEHYFKKMGVVPIIDRMAPSHSNREISHGEAAAALMVYLLNGGRALYQMEKWAEESAALDHIFPHYQPSDWTDDRLADTLDELHKANLEPMQGSISANIITEFGLKLDDIHYDTTSVSLWGTYDSAAEQPAVLITFGHSKAHRPDLKQIVVGTAVSGDGGVPIVSGTHNGNTSDSVLPISYWERLRQVAGKSSFCFIGDCKIASLKTLKEVCAQNGQFLAPMAMSSAEQEKLIKKLKEGKLNFEPLDLEDEKTLRPIYEKRPDQVGNRKKDISKTPASYKACEESWEIKDNQDRPHTLRKLIIHSERLARLNAKTRKSCLQKAAAELEALHKKLNKRKLTTREAIEAAGNKVLCRCQVQGLMEFRVVEQVETERKKVGKGRPGPNSEYVTEEKVVYGLEIDGNQQAIEEKALLDGIFLMVSNHKKQEWPTSRLLALYKRQYKVERVFSVLKGPLAVSPMLLEKLERICSMMFIMTLTLQLYTLIQRQAALELSQRGSPLEGLMPNKIKTWRPQTDKLLAAFDNINLVEIVDAGTSSSHMTSLSSLQSEVLQLLGVPVSKYSLDAFP